VLSPFTCLLVTSRSRAFQISLNLTVIEEWIEEMGLPAGVQVHLAPVKDLLNWLQVRWYELSLRPSIHL